MKFGERCGFYQAYLSRLERGQANPTLNAMEVIANALGLTVYELWDAVERLQAETASRSLLPPLKLGGLIDSDQYCAQGLHKLPPPVACTPQPH